MSTTSPVQRTALRRALNTAVRSPGLPSDLRELAHELVAELEPHEGVQDPFFAHNLAVLQAGVAGDPSLSQVSQELASASISILTTALDSDPDDLALALAISSVPSTIDSASLVNRLADATTRPHAGDRLITAVSESLAQQATSPPNVETKKAIPHAAVRLVEQLDALNAREPDRENIVWARLALLHVIASSAGGQSQTDAYERLESLFLAADRHFGPSPERSALRLQALCSRLATRQLKTPKALINAAVRNAVELAEHELHPVAVINFVNALHAKGWLQGQRARDLSAALAHLSQSLPNNTDVRDAHTRALEATGDDMAVVEHHAALVRSGRAGDDSTVVLARHWIHRLQAGAPSGLDAETEHWVAGAFPGSVASTVSPETRLLLLERVAATSGPMTAGHLGASVLLAKRAAAADSVVVIRTVQLLADGGEPERALSVGHKHLKSADTHDLRLTLAKIHIGAAIRIAEAETLLRPLASASGAIAAEARALREQVVNHPTYETERLALMLETERRLGIGTDKSIRARVLFPSDRYVLAELPDVRAPSFYQHRYLRVMVTEKSLPAGIALADMPKGTEFAAKVIGEDDNKGDRIRIYWVGNDPIEIIARPPQPTTDSSAEPASAHQKEAPAKDSKNTRSESAASQSPALTKPEAVADPELEARFGIGGTSPVRIRIDKVMLRRGLLLGRILASDASGEEFPHRVGIHRRYIPSALKKARFKGAVVQATVARADTEKLRYDVTCEFTLVTAAPDAVPSAPTTRDNPEGTNDNPQSTNDDAQTPDVTIAPQEATEASESASPEVTSPPNTDNVEGDNATTETTTDDDKAEELPTASQGEDAAPESDA